MSQTKSRLLNTSLSLRSSLMFLYIEGSFALAYETLIGPQYLSGLAGEVKAPVFYVTLLNSLPWLGTTGQILGAFVFLFLQNRWGPLKITERKYTLMATLLARCFWIIPLLAAAHYFFVFSRGSFPADRWFTVVAITATCASFVGSSASTTWMSWMRALIHPFFTGRFFATRQRYVMAALIVINIVGSRIVSIKSDGIWTGYVFLGTSAVLFAFISTFVLMKVPEPSQRHFTKTKSIALSNFWMEFQKPFKNKEFIRFAQFIVLFQGVVQFAGPYFAYYFTKQLEVPMATFTIWILCANLGNLLASVLWAKMVDLKHGSIRVMRIGTFLVACSPIPYIIFKERTQVMWFAPLEFFFNGAAWSAIMIGMSSGLFKRVPREHSTLYFPIFAALNGIICFFFSGIGGLFVSHGGDFQTLFIIGTLLRFAVLFAKRKFLFP